MDARTPPPPPPPPPHFPDLPRTRSRNRKHPDPDRQVLHVEYSFANPDFSMHDSDSGSSATDTDDLATASTSASAAARRDERSMRRVVVMHDSRGRPAHIPMAQFYYDSVARSNNDDDDDDDDDDGGGGDDGGGRDGDARNASNDDGAQQQPAASADSSSSAVPQNKPHGHHRFRVHHRRREGNNGPQDEDRLDGSPDEAEVAPPPNRLTPASSAAAAPKKFAADGQFMHITAPSSELRDASTVERDPGPGANRMGRRASVIAGLRRAVSAVRLSDAVIGEPDDSSEPTDAETAEPAMLQREREGIAEAPRRRESQAQTAPKRQTLSSVGRMTTTNKPRSTAPAISPTTPISPVSPASSIASSQKPPSPDASPHGAQMRPRSSLSGLGRFLSTNRRKMDVTPLSTSPSSPDTHMQQTSLGEQRRPSSTRLGLNRIGRMISVNRTKPGATMHADTGHSAQDRPRQGASLVPDLRRAREARLLDDKPGAQLSPLSTSTLSLASTESPAGAERAPRKRESTRMRLRGAGRILSLRRHDGAHGDAGGGGNGNDAALRLRMSRRQPTISSAGAPSQGRAQTMPLRATPDADVSPPRGPDIPRDTYTFENVTSPAVLATGLLTGNPPQLRIPVIAMGEFSDPISRRKWHIDAFTLPHNAVRKECADLYEILTALARVGGGKGGEAKVSGTAAGGSGGQKPSTSEDSSDAGSAEKGALTDEMLTKFETWWEVACGFFRAYFDMERRVLLPWVDSAGPQDLEVQMALKKMRSMKEKIEQHLSKVDRVWREKAFKTSGELLALLYTAIDDFAPRMLNYFLDQEVLLPAIVKQYYDVDKRLRLDKDMVAAFMEESQTPVRRGKASARHNLILLVRWMTDPKQLRAWIGQHLNASCRGSYSRWYALYESEHANLVRELRALE